MIKEKEIKMTNLMYLAYTYLFTAEAHVIDVRTLEGGRTAIILDQTIFYPQGGGQPCDKGIITSVSAQFDVNDVRLDKDGIVYHIGSFTTGIFKAGEVVSLAIDEQRRIAHAKLHSAAHLLDCAVSTSNLPLKPTKGYHFPEGPYVEYEGTIEASDNLIHLLQEKVNGLIAQNIPVIINQLTSEQAQEQGITAPAGKSARVVSFQEFKGCGCGGTHVRSSGEIGQMIIRKLKSKGNITRISYDIQNL